MLIVSSVSVRPRIIFALSVVDLTGMLQPLHLHIHCGQGKSYCCLILLLLFCDYVGIR